jgi:hypothetical protein
VGRKQANAAQDVQKTTVGAAGKQAEQASALEGKLIPSYESMMNEGFSPEGLNAMRTGATEPIAAAADTANWMGENRAARTGNAASQDALASELARNKGVDIGRASAEVEAANEQQRQSNKRFALQGEQGLFGSNLSAEESLYGMQPGIINSWNTAASTMNPWMQLAGQAIGAGGQVGAAAVGKPG